MQKREQKFQTKFNQYLRDYGEVGAYELKHSHGKTWFDLKKVSRHQKRALLMVKKRGYWTKHSDSAIGYKPFDCYFLKGVAYVVIQFPTLVTLIDIEKIIELGDKRITESEAEMIATKNLYYY
jgi:hypothetical protein